MLTVCNTNLSPIPNRAGRQMSRPVFRRFTHSDFRPPTLCCCAVCMLCRVSACLSDTSRCSVETAERIKLVLGTESYSSYPSPRVEELWVYVKNKYTSFWNLLPSVLWRCWLGGRKGIRPVKNRVVGCWCGYLSGTRCRLAYGPAGATAAHCLLLQ